MTLNLVNTLTKVSYNIENLTDLMTNSINYVFNINLPANMDSGEYNYTLYDDEMLVVASGIMQIGSYEPEKTAYTAQTINNYIQYEG